MRGKKLAAQGVLTCCATRPLTYHLYADEGELLVFDASMTSVSLSKIFFDKLRPSRETGRVSFYLEGNPKWALIWAAASWAETLEFSMRI